ncbi:IS3 family transposase, partial [Vibrio splendidus]
DLPSLVCPRATESPNNIKRQSGLSTETKPGNCWDNACVESFFHSMKVEAVQYEPIMNRETIRQHIFEYIEIDYNKNRSHSALGYLSPERFEQLNVA